VSFADLLDRRLILISGKGGVGKTVVSSALGLLAARAGKRVLLVKLDDQGQTARLFDVPALGDRVTPLCDGVAGIHLDPVTIVSDYFQRQLRVRRLVRHITSSRLFQSWFRVTPAIKEMICLGKVWDLVEERTFWRKHPVWDLVVFDAPATGHGLGLLRLPQQAGRLLMGPMRTSALGVQALLEDPAQTSLVVVTIPEEMPVNEAIHFVTEARRHLEIDLAGVVLNQAHPERLADEPATPALAAAGEPALAALLGDGAPPDAVVEALDEARGRARARAELTRRYGDQLRAAVDLPVVELPRLFARSFGLAELEQVAAALAAVLAVEAPA